MCSVPILQAGSRNAGVFFCGDTAGTLEKQKALSH